MRRLGVLILMLLTGCSTAPVADLLDLVKPGRLPPGPYRGGVYNQPIVPPAAPAPFPPAVPVVPAPPP